MALNGTHLGMNLTVDDLDVENTAYFGHCARHDFHLQRCDDCALLRYPPTTACPFCTCLESTWVPVPGKGVGEWVEFGGLLGRAPVIPVNRHDCSVFVRRGGRIPAPLQALNN